MNRAAPLMLAFLVFVITLFVLGAVFGMALVDVPAKYAFVPLIAELAIPLGAAMFTYRLSAKLYREFEADEKPANKL